MKNKYIVFYVLCFAIVSGVTLLSNNYFFYQLQSRLGTFDSIKIGKALVSKPKNWFVAYIKNEYYSYGYFYGYIPYSLPTKPHCLMFFVAKELESANEIVFCQMDQDFINKSKTVMEKVIDAKEKDIKVIKVNGFDGLMFKDKSIDIPVLGISIISNKFENLSQFVFTSP